MAEGKAHVLVWDWAVRLFHWTLVLLVAAQWWTAENHMMDWHRRLGVAVLGLIAFRLIWGLVGPATARFSFMALHPRGLIAYVRGLFGGGHTASYGHNPVGTLSVFAMLAALCVQVGTGLFAVDVDGLESGPLASLISFEAGRQAAEIHEVAFNVLLALIALHVVAIATYLIFFRDNLVRPMITGRRKATDFGDAAPADNKVSLVRWALAVLVAFAAMWAATNLG